MTSAIKNGESLVGKLNGQWGMIKQVQSVNFVRGRSLSAINVANVTFVYKLMYFLNLRVKNV